MQAFSDPNGIYNRFINYSRITFCSGFFRLPTLDEAMEIGQFNGGNDLANYDNRARCFFHEVTHLDYFMNSGQNDEGLSPVVSDLEIEIRTPGSGRNYWDTAYGPFNAKLLRNYQDADPQYSGYYTQRNADNFAFFALAKYIERELNRYPSGNSPGQRRVFSEPRDAITKEEPLSTGPRPAGPGVDESMLDGNPQENAESAEFSHPGCGDRTESSFAQNPRPV